MSGKVATRLTRFQQAAAILMVVLLAGGGLAALHGPVGPAPPASLDTAEDAPAGQDALSELSRGPLLRGVVFEENRGQAEEWVRFTATSASGKALLGKEGMTIVGGGDVLQLRFSSPAPDVTLRGEERLPSVGHHYRGDASQWVQGAPHFAQVRYEGLYPGIDLVVYGTPEGHVEFDHLLAPGADPAQARYTVSGDPVLTEDGALLTHEGAFRLRPPVAHQEGPEGPQEVGVSFRPDGDGITYALGAYDPLRPLTIDPVITYSSYIGTSGFDTGEAVAVVDGAAPHLRDVYIGGYTQGGAFPAGFGTTSTHGPAGGTMDGFIAKLEYDRGTRIATPQWIAYLGGSGSDHVRALAADAAGVVVAGDTASTDFPVQNAVEIPTAAYDGSVAREGRDVFVVRLDPAGSLDFSTYLGGDGPDRGYVVDIGPDGHLLVAGRTLWTLTGAMEFPTFNAPQPHRWGTSVEAFAAKIDASTSPSSVVFSTMIGGGGVEYAYGISEDATGVTVGGHTSPTGHAIPDFPTTPGAHQETLDTGKGGFVTKIPREGGATWAYSTLLDGDGADSVEDLTTDSAGNAWLTGSTSSTNLPTTANAVSATVRGGQDAFLVQLSSDGSSVLYGSYIGGAGASEHAYGIDLTASDDVLLTGYTNSLSGFPLLAETQSVHAGGRGSRGPNSSPTHVTDAFVLRVDAGSGALEFGTYLGGPGDELGQAVAGDDAGNTFVTGVTDSSPFALASPHQPALAGGPDAFFTVFGKRPPLPVIEARAPGHPVGSTPRSAPYTVLTSEDILLDGSGSVPGDEPIDPLTAFWELKDGPTVVATDAGTWNPTFPGYHPLSFGLPRQLEVCLTVEDVTGGPYDHQGRVCMDLAWSNRSPVGTLACPAQVAVGRELVLLPSVTDPEGEGLAFAWDWGDGNTSSGDPGVHTYGKKGQYNVTLNATDPRTAFGEFDCQVAVGNGPLADFSYDGTLLMKEPVGFQDLSVAADRPIETWTWDFGDGSAPVELEAVASDFSYIFDAPGTYPVTLTVFDGGLHHEVTHNVTIVKAEPLPMPDQYAAIVARPLEVPSHNGLLLNDDHTGGWSLEVHGHTQPGNGSVDVEPDGSFTYTSKSGFVGTDTFTYHVTDGTTPVGPIGVEVEVRSALPALADFHFVVSGTTVVFEDRSRSGDMDIEQWRWRFSDGTEASGRNPYHDFLPGHQSATLHVTDAAGGTSSVTKDFHVQGSGVAAPVAPERSGGALPAADPEPPAAGAANQPPTAVASGPANVLAGEEVRLDGSRSSDPDGDDLSFHWRQVGGPPVAFVVQDEGVFFTAPSRSGTLVFELEASDGHALDTARVAVEVRALAVPTFEVEVSEDGTHWFNTTEDASWSLGDGTTATGGSVAHRFAGPGAYLVRMEVDGVESVQSILVEAAGRPDLLDAEPAVDAEPGADPAQVASVPEPRVPTAVMTTAAGVGLLVLLLWAYRTWALVWVRVFTRVGRPKLLDHPVRAQIHDAVQDRPGILLTDLVPLVGKSRGTVAHHVGMLESAGMLGVARAAGYVSLHPAGSPRAGMEEATVRSPVARRLLKAAQTSPGQTVGELARDLGVTHQTVGYHVGRLEQAGLIQKVREGNATRLFAVAARQDAR